ncbi:MAG TPA: CCA tRNA nucleotidyltransferase [Gemmatimonadaceae bacterium]|jgi:tRNA nucleotidyltransferase (CCA-adding enzyme)|nr:CCA tRNA nucleotidyltransferase [Gemmatimonadaceae bacterium]
MPRLNPPPAVLEIAARLERAGFEAWCVGGAIRDALLGHPHLDWDLATSATPDQLRELFGLKRTVPVGIVFGTVGVLDRTGAMHEVTTFRRDVHTDGRHAQVEFGVSLEDDLARRDFTINAIAYSAARDELRDPFGGRKDLERRLVRAVGDADTRMREDRLRALRAIRFAARFGFAIDEATRSAIDASAPFLGRLSAERVKQELDKTMEQVRRPGSALEIWQRAGAFRTLIPRLADAEESALRAPDFAAMPGPRNRPARRVIRFAAMLATLPAADAAGVMTDLRGSKHEIQTVENLVDRWQRLGRDMEAIMRSSVPTDVQIRRWVAAIGRLRIGAFMRLAIAMWCADDRESAAARAARRAYRRMLRSAFVDAVDIGSLAVDGDDLRRSGIPPGPGLGKILQILLDAVIEDPARNTTDWLLQEAKRLRADAVSGSGVVDAE